MKRMKVAAICLAVMMTFTGCGGNNSSGNVSSTSEHETNAKESSQQESVQKNSTAKADTVINIWIAGSGEKSMDDAYKTVLNSYCENHEGVGYEITYIPWSDYFTKLNTGLAGASGPDIFMLGYGQIGSVQRAGNLLNLSEYIPEDWDGYEDFYENILDICKMDDSYYALFKPSNRNFFYRKDIAEQNGVTEEDLHITSPQDFLSLVEKMTVKDDKGNVQVYGMEVDPDSEQELFTYLGMFSEHPLFWEDDYTAAFASEECINALTFMNDIYKTGNASLKDANEGSSGLASGVAAMCIGANSEYVTADNAFPGNIGVVKDDMNTLLIGDYLAVNAATKIPVVAADLFLHMFSEESVQVFAVTAGQYSGRKSLDGAFTAINPDYENIVAMYANSFSYGKPMHPNFSECAAFLRTAIESSFSGIAPKDALEEGKTNWDSVLNK